jgi:hypothetical protein
VRCTPLSVIVGLLCVALPISVGLTDDPFFLKRKVGINEISENGITRKILYFLMDRTMTPSTDPLRRVRKSRILLYVALQLWENLPR